MYKKVLSGKNRKTKPDLVFGFTLVELLVVIAIISLISSVVLAALRSAQSRSADTTVKAAFNSLIKQAEIVYDAASPNNYVGVCGNSIVGQILTNAASAEGLTWSPGNNTTEAFCASASTPGVGGYWIAYIHLKKADGRWLCFDNRTIPFYEGSSPGLVVNSCP